MVVPTGMFLSGSVLPTLMGASAPDTSCMPALTPFGGDDVAALAVGVAQQREERAAVGIVLEALDFRRDAVLVALEVDLAVELLVAAALVAHGDLAVHVAAALLVLALDEMRHRPALVQVGIDDLDLLALAGGDGSAP